MSKQSPTLLGGGRPLGGQPLGNLRGGPALSPLPPKGKRGARWLLWLILIPLLLLGLTYVTGRTVEPIRAQLEQIPVVGPLLFAGKVWPILWNKPVEKPPGRPAAETPATNSGTTQQPAAPPIDSKLLDEAAARLAAAESKEADLKRREAELKAREKTLQELEAKLTASVSASDALRTQLQGQLRSELDKVEFVRNMSRTQQAAFFEALTDDEAVRILKYMNAEEIGKILGGMNPYRAARIFQQMPATAQPTTTP